MFQLDKVAKAGFKIDMVDNGDADWPIPAMRIQKRNFTILLVVVGNTMVGDLDVQWTFENAPSEFHEFARAWPSLLCSDCGDVGYRGTLDGPGDAEHYLQSPGLETVMFWFNNCIL